MKRKILKVAVIGLGRIGWQTHIPQVLKHDGFELCAVVDPLCERLEEASKEFGVTGLYQNTDELFAAEKLDLVIIASPTAFHCAQTLQAFEHGCDVFCDKPMAISLEEADIMIAAMKRAKRKLMIYQPRRAIPHIVALKNVLEKDLIGTIFMIKRSVTSYIRRSDWQAFKVNGGGMLNNYGAHFIDQLLYLTRSRCKHAFCQLNSIISGGDADDVVKAVITTDNNIMLDVDINMACSQNAQPWLICGMRGSITYDNTQGAWHVRHCNGTDLAELEASRSLAAANRMYGNGERISWCDKFFKDSDFKQVDFFDECYKYFSLDEKPFVPIEQTREVMRTLKLCHAAAETN
jgi:predicted dehydrogenase